MHAYYECLLTCKQDVLKEEGIAEEKEGEEMTAQNDCNIKADYLVVE